MLVNETQNDIMQMGHDGEKKYIATLSQTGKNVVFKKQEAERIAKEEKWLPEFDRISDLLKKGTWLPDVIDTGTEKSPAAVREFNYLFDRISQGDITPEEARERARKYLADKKRDMDSLSSDYRKEYDERKALADRFK